MAGQEEQANKPNFEFDLEGKKFGRWTVTGYSHRKGTKYFWFCECECGGKKVVDGWIVRSGQSSSCGCLYRETRVSRKTHGMHDSYEYRKWQMMRSRCSNPNIDGYEYYGGRGIKVCDRWNHGQGGFEAFIDDMGLSPSKEHTIDRIDCNGDYCPENCRWASVAEQCRNTRRSIKATDKNGVTKNICDWARDCGCSSSSLLSKRIDDGMTIDEAIADYVSRNEKAIARRNAARCSS